MDPEQIYQEVLQEEQQKGSPSAVAEGRAKAARQRARHGSPHPKEPRWWPGAQPQFEGGGGAPAEEAPAEEAPAAEAPTGETEVTAAAEPQPAADTAAEPPLAEETTATQGTPPPVPADQPPASQPEQVPATVAAATGSGETSPAPEQRPAGVTHGVPTGNRLRPEDSVGSEAQFAGQQAMYERRKLIDELVATGVPEVTAAEVGTRGSPVLALLYLIIPLLAIGMLVANDGGAAAGGEDHGGSQQEGNGGALTVLAEGVAFDTETLELPAEQDVTIEFDNRDAGAVHNIAIYEDESAEKNLFDGQDITGPASTTYEFKAPPAGEYYFHCDTHPDMNGTVVAQ